MVLKTADIAPPHLLSEPVDDLDAGKIAFVHGSIESLPGESFLMDRSIGIAIEEATELGLQLADAFRRRFDQQPGKVLVVEPAAAFDRVHEVPFDRILR